MRTYHSQVPADICIDSENSENLCAVVQWWKKYLIETLSMLVWPVYLVN